MRGINQTHHMADNSEAVLQLSLINLSEPTRLRRITYASFCMKKKNKNSTTKHQDQNQIKAQTNKHLQTYKT